MEFIKDKEKVANSVNELIDYYGNPKELAESIDILIFDWVGYFVKSGECGSEWYSDKIAKMKAIRDFFLEIETK